MNQIPTPAFEIDRLIGLGRVNAVAPSPCGSWLAVEVSRLDSDGAKYISDLWRVSLDKDTEPVQLTRGASSDRAPWFRNDGRLGFLSNRNPRDGDAEDGDDKRFQVWLLVEEGGDPSPLTDEPLGVSEFRFARNADRLIAIAPVLPGVEHDKQREAAADRAKHGPSALRYTTMPIRHWDHWLPPEAPHVIAYSGEGSDRRDLTPDADREHRYGSWDVSADGATVAITDKEAGADRVFNTGLALIDCATGAHNVVGREEASELFGPKFSPDGSRIACARERRSRETVRMDCVILTRQGELTALATDWDAWPTPVGWTPDGQRLVVSCDWRGEAPLFYIDTGDSSVTRITAEASAGSHSGCHLTHSGDAVVGIRSTYLQPPEPFCVALAAQSSPRIPARLSGLPADFGPENARVESFTVDGEDGTPVQSFLVLPATGSGPWPLLFWPHGGPIGAHNDGWHWRWNALHAASAGFAVALPNPRGSTGFGQKFVDGIWQNQWGGACYTDLLAVYDALVQRDDVDGDRTICMGGSFGGYMTNWMAANTDRFSCAITHASLYWLSAFHAATDYPAWWAIEMGGTPYDDLEAFDRFSPHRFVANWKTPTLIIHGEKDYRVPIGEALALFEGLQLHGIESELLVFPDENHWIEKPRNIKVWYDAWREFAWRHV